MSVLRYEAVDPGGCEYKTAPTEPQHSHVLLLLLLHHWSRGCLDSMLSFLQPDIDTHPNESYIDSRPTQNSI